MNIREIRLALDCGRRDGMLTEAMGNWERINSIEHLKGYVSQIKQRYEEFSATMTKLLTYSDFIIYDRTGSRREYELVYFERRMRLNTFALSAMLDPSAEKIEKLQNILWQICDEYTWCLPAHIKDDIEHKKTVDLFASETAFAMAEILHVMNGKMDELVVTRVRREIFERVINPYMDIRRTTRWDELTNNWAAVCAGSIGAAAMYLMDDDDSLAAVLLKVLSAMEAYLDGFSDDGACLEGLSYWMYGFAYFTSFSALLKERTGGKIDLFNSDKVRNIMEFPQKCYLSGNHVVSYSDGSGTFRHNPGILRYLKRINNDVKMPPAQYQTGFPNDHCARWVNDIRNLIWNTEEDSDCTADTENRYESFFLEESGWFIGRINDGTAFSTKTGHNDEPHNHNDVGSFIYHRNGENYLTDLGAGEYTKEYFREARYDFLCNGSHGHSVPIINGQFQSAGIEYVGSDMRVVSDGNKDIISYRMESAYDIGQLKILKRNFVFCSDTGKLTLTDELEADEKVELVERFVTKLSVEKGNGCVKIRGNETAIIKYDEETLEVSVTETEYKNHSAVPEKVYLIDFTLKEHAQSVRLVFGFEFYINP